MMGDNRDNSLDSRFDPASPTIRSSAAAAGTRCDSRRQAGVGFVPEENLVGRASSILLSWNSDERLRCSSPGPGSPTRGRAGSSTSCSDRRAQPRAWIGARRHRRARSASGPQLRRPRLLERALTHASVGAGLAQGAHNERLEFLGDRVLGLWSPSAAGARSGRREGELAKRLHALVSRQACAEVARARRPGRRRCGCAGGDSKSGGARQRHASWPTPARR